MALPKATDHYTYQMSPKLLVNVIPYAQLPDSMTSFAKKAKIQTLDWCNISKCCDMIGARYIPLCGNLIGVRYIPLCSNLIGVKYIPLYMLKERFFFIEKKNNWELCSRTPHYFPYFLLFIMSPGLTKECFDMWVGFLVVPWYHYQINGVLQIYTGRRNWIG